MYHEINPHGFSIASSRVTYTLLLACPFASVIFEARDAPLRVGSGPPKISMRRPGTGDIVQTSHVNMFGWLAW